MLSECKDACRAEALCKFFDASSTLCMLHTGCVVGGDAFGNAGYYNAYEKILGMVPPSCDCDEIGVSGGYERQSSRMGVFTPL